MSLKKNFIYSSLLTASNYIFPIIVYPYISRVLGPSNIGICNFVDSIINYFTMFAMMGINIIGIREIAALRNNEHKRNTVFTSLLTLNILFTIIAIGLLIILIFTVPKFQEQPKLLWSGVCKLIFNVMLMEWLYKGLENFKYITIRSVCIKCLYIICVFTLIRKAEDYTLYYFLTALTVAINAVVNIIFSKSFIKLSYSKKTTRKLLSPFLTTGLYIILTQLYLSFNVVFLGFYAPDSEVGYYSSSTRLISIILSIYTAWTSAALPRMSAYFQESNMKEFKDLLHKSFILLLTFAFPVIILLINYNHEIIRLFLGKDFVGSQIPLYVQTPLIFIIGYSQILIIQLLMPTKRDKTLFIISAIGATVCVCANILLTPTHAAIGSSFSWLISELIVLTVAIIVSRNYYDFAFPWREIVKYTLYHAPLFIICWTLQKHTLWTVIPSITIGGVIIVSYTLFLQIYVIKNQFIISLFKNSLSFLVSHKHHENSKHQ